MNIDGVVFSDYEPTGDTFLDTMIHGIDWHCHPLHGLMLKSEWHTLYLSEIVGYDRDGEMIFYGENDLE